MIDSPPSIFTRVLEQGLSFSLRILVGAFPCSSERFVPTLVSGSLTCDTHWNILYYHYSFKEFTGMNSSLLGYTVVCDTLIFYILFIIGSKVWGWKESALNTVLSL